jgi:hypothetical protein
MRFVKARVIRKSTEIAPMRADAYRGRGPCFLQVKVAPDSPGSFFRPATGHLKNRFRAALLGRKAGAG